MGPVRRAAPRRRLGAAIVGVAFVAAGCLGGGSTGAGRASGPAKSSGATGPTTTSTLADPGCRYILANTIPRETPDPVSTDPDLLDLLRSAVVLDPALTPCADVVQFTFQPVVPVKNTPPHYRVEYLDGPVTEPNDKGIEVSVALEPAAETVVLKVVFAPASIRDTTNPRKPLTYTGNLKLDLPPGLAHILMVRKYFNEQLGAVTWLIQLDREQPFTVDAVRSPLSSTVTVYVMR